MKTQVHLCFLIFNQPLIAFIPIFSLSGFQKKTGTDFGTILYVGWLTSWRWDHRKPLLMTRVWGLVVFYRFTPGVCCWFFFVSPLIFVLYTDGWQSICESRFIVMFADYSVIISLLQDHEVDHGPVIDNFPNSAMTLTGGSVNLKPQRTKGS